MSAIDGRRASAIEPVASHSTRGYSRPHRTTPQSSHTPSTAESAKPMTEMTFMPSSAARLREDPDQARPDQPAGDDERDHEPVEHLAACCSRKPSSPLWTKPTSICPSRTCSIRSCHWYGASRRTPARSGSRHARARRATRSGVKRSSISPRAYGRATSNTLKSGYSSTPTEPSVAIARSSSRNRDGSCRFIV